MGGIGSAWERNARRRHRRRLEVLQAKAELKAAQAAARGGAVAAASLPPLTTATATTPTARAGGPTTQGTQLERLFASHDAVTARWLDYELDVAKIIAFPAMSDGRQPLTAAFLRAKRIADGLRPASAKARLTQGPAHRVPQRGRGLRGRVRRRRARRAAHQGLVVHRRSSASASTPRSSCSRSRSTRRRPRPSARSPTAACAKSSTGSSRSPTRRSRCSRARSSLELTTGAMPQAPEADRALPRRRHGTPDAASRETGCRSRPGRSHAPGRCPRAPPTRPPVASSAPSPIPDDPTVRLRWRSRRTPPRRTAGVLRWSHG